jgi:hypothetical protein
VTYYVALAFKRGEDDGGDTVVCDPKEAEQIAYWCLEKGDVLFANNIALSGSYSTFPTSACHTFLMNFTTLSMTST